MPLLVAGGGCVVDGLSAPLVKTWADAEKLLLIGDEKRHIAATDHNDRSSRAHTVFRLKIKRVRAPTAVTV